MQSTVLVVDDNQADLRNVQRQLRDTYLVIQAKSGEQALKVCSKMRPDLILLTIEMSEMDGFEVLERLGRTPALSTIPVIFLSETHDIDIEIKGFQRGAADFIAKPVNKSILLHRIGHHLRFHRYQHMLEENVRELEGGIVLGFCEIVEFRDGNTGGHIGRSSRYVQLLGETLRKQSKKMADLLPESDLDMIVRAAPLHDIGKIGIRDQILLKPGPLTEDEYALAKEHTRIGGRILLNIYRRTPSQHYLKVAALMAEGHHERYDGHGYPCGLAGCDIPLCCRIMAVANVYDACITDRIYRRGMTHEEAHEIITKGAGTAFDPLVVKAFEEVREGFLSLKIPSYQLFDDSRLI